MIPVVNIIKPTTLTHHQFKSFLEENESEYKNVTCPTEISGYILEEKTSEISHAFGWNYHISELKR